MKTRHQNKKHVTFFALFDESEETVASHLRQSDMRFAYALYKEGSLFIHGSTIDQLFCFEDDTVTPLLVGADDAVASTADSVGSSSNNTMVLLYMIQKELWPIR
jgi:hypothetical protein